MFFIKLYFYAGGIPSIVKPYYPMLLVIFKHQNIRFSKIFMTLTKNTYPSGPSIKLCT